MPRSKSFTPQIRRPTSCSRSAGGHKPQNFYSEVPLGHLEAELWPIQLSRPPVLAHSDKDIVREEKDEGILLKDAHLCSLSLLRLAWTQTSNCNKLTHIWEIAACVHEISVGAVHVDCLRIGGACSPHQLTGFRACRGAFSKLPIWK